MMLSNVRTMLCVVFVTIALILKKLTLRTVKPFYQDQPWDPIKWPLYIGGCSLEVFQSKLIRLGVVARWLLFRGGR